MDEQEEVLILSLQATISSLEKKVSALRRSEQAAMKVVAAYRKLWDSTTQVMRGRPIKFVTGTSRVETRWDKKAIKSLVAELDKLEAKYSPAKSAGYVDDFSKATADVKNDEF